MLVALAGLHERDRVGSVRVLDERRRLGGRGGSALGAGDVGEAASRRGLVVVALERPVAGEGVVVGVRRRDVDLQRRAERGPAVARLLVIGVDRRREQRRRARLVACAIGDVDEATGGRDGHVVVVDAVAHRIGVHALRQRPGLTLVGRLADHRVVLAVLAVATVVPDGVERSRAVVDGGGR